jgi:hypothetical protein
MSTAIVCSDLTFAWPDGAPVLGGLNLVIGPGRTGLLGVNGVRPIHPAAHPGR